MSVNSGVGSVIQRDSTSLSGRPQHRDQNLDERPDMAVTLACVSRTGSEPVPVNGGADEWYCRLSGAELGPMSFDGLVKCAQRGQMLTDDEVRFGAKGQWRQVGSVGRLMAELPFQAGEKKVTPSASKSKTPAVDQPDVVDQQSATNTAPPPATMYTERDLEIAYQVAYEQAKAQIAQALIAQGEAAYQAVEEQAKAELTRSTAQNRERDWWGWMNGIEFGPVDFMHVFTLAKFGQLKSSEFVRNGQFGQPVAAANVPGLFNAAAMVARAAEVLNIAKSQAQAAVTLAGPPPKMPTTGTSISAVVVKPTEISPVIPVVSSSRVSASATVPPQQREPQERFTPTASATSVVTEPQHRKPPSDRRHAIVASTATTASRLAPASDIEAVPSDDEVLRGVADCLAQQKTASFARIGMDVKRGVITVRGDVASETERLTLLILLQRIPGVIKVNDGLSISSPVARRPVSQQIPMRTFSGGSTTSLSDRTNWTDWQPHIRMVAAVCSVLIVGLLGYWYATLGPSRPVAVHPVKGRALFEGQPMSGANVVLHPSSSSKVPAELRPRGSVAADGTFALSTFDPNDGAPSGDFVITVVWSKPVVVDGETQFGPNLAPATYSKPESSPLKITIAPGTKELKPLELKHLPK